MYDDIYWVGSGYEWDANDDLPTEAGKEKLISELEKILTVPFEIIDHKAAIRPTIYIRRPIVKVHSTNPEMVFFNGLGTKGASIGPFYAKQLAKYLVYKNPEDLNYN
ncbi:MAG: FAD-binding oxidoreductase [Saprospiraceae bacterium]|nr:FAD-binding oxidoreductase [Saprospiraceae bacterium]